MDLRNCLYCVVVVMLLLVAAVEGDAVDIRAEIPTVMKMHNDARRDDILGASNMMEMVWDERLARDASDYASQCLYRRPPLSRYNVGSNLFFQFDFVHGKGSIHNLITKSVESWIRHKDLYMYGRHCGMSCPYVQMIRANTRKVGCALQTCQDMGGYGDSDVPFVSLFVCFYSSRLKMNEGYPFKLGYTCSECPYQTTCRDGLCAMNGEEPVPVGLALPEERDNGIYTGPVQDRLTDREIYYLSSSHNRMRENYDADPITWDSYLQGWCDWIVNCDSDFPGPRHTYTNFHRLTQGDLLYNVVYDWAAEGERTHLRLEHGCRTPNDASRCNHFTNIRQPDLTSFACATRDCYDGTRQLVCVYDRRSERPGARHSRRHANRNRRHRNRNSHHRRFQKDQA